MLIVVATLEEIGLVEENSPVIVTGVGAINVIETLRDVDREEHIHNIGYAGSNIIRIGERVRVGEVGMHQSNVHYKEKRYKLDGDVPCYTASDFVTETDEKEPCVFDMELAYILALGFKHVTAEKVVSDNLSVKEYYETVDGGMER